MVIKHGRTVAAAVRGGGRPRGAYAAAAHQATRYTSRAASLGGGDAGIDVWRLISYVIAQLIAQHAVRAYLDARAVCWSSGGRYRGNHGAVGSRTRAAGAMA